MLFGLFSKITRKDTVSRKFAIGDDDVYLYVLFPIAVAFLLTFMGARLISHIDPYFYLHIVPGLHIHHYSYGIFVLAISGYLALAAKSPRDKYLISLLHGLGLGLAFDEFGIWLNLANNSANRFSYDGVVMLTGLFLLLISMESGLRVWRKHFGRKTYATEAAAEAENDPILG